MSLALDPRSLLAIATGHMASRALCVATRMGYFDELSAASLPSGELARRTGSDPDAALRLLRALASLGLASEDEPGQFSITELAVPLRRGAAASVRELVLLFGSERTWRSWEHLADSMRSGRAASLDLYAMNGFDYFERHPAQAATFHAAMAEVSHLSAQALVRTYDFARHESIADIGGGSGALIAQVLAAAPGARGLLFDLATALHGAAQQLRDAGVQDRCAVLAGDFFEAIPAGVDLYLLKNILHDWDDARCARILARLRTAMRPGSTAMIVERIVAERTEASADHRQVAIMDLNMLVTSGGRERTAAQFDALLRDAGLRMLEPPLRLPAPSPYALLRVCVAGDHPTGRPA